MYKSYVEVQHGFNDRGQRWTVAFRKWRYPTVATKVVSVKRMRIHERDGIPDEDAKLCMCLGLVEWRLQRAQFVNETS